jgi:hypothetical protein
VPAPESSLKRLIHKTQLPTEALDTNH